MLQCGMVGVNSTETVLSASFTCYERHFPHKYKTCRIVNYLIGSNPVLYRKDPSYFVQQHHCIYTSDYQRTPTCHQVTHLPERTPQGSKKSPQRDPDNVVQQSVLYHSQTEGREVGEMAQPDMMAEANIKIDFLAAMTTSYPQISVAV